MRTCFERNKKEGKKWEWEIWHPSLSVILCIVIKNTCKSTYVEKSRKKLKNAKRLFEKKEEECVFLFIITNNLSVPAQSTWKVEETYT